MKTEACVFRLLWILPSGATTITWKRRNCRVEMQYAYSRSPDSSMIVEGELSIAKTIMSTTLRLLRMGVEVDLDLAQTGRKLTSDHLVYDILASIVRAIDD
jgi:hypothetical protein